MKGSKVQQKTLCILQKQFRTYRRKSKSKSHYPEKLRSLAIGALNEGLRVRQVASACGVSHLSVMSWRDRHPSPIELNVVESRSSSVPSLEAMARIRINDLEIAIPTSALTRSLIESISGGLR